MKESWEYLIKPIKSLSLLKKLKFLKYIIFIIFLAFLLSIGIAYFIYLLLEGLIWSFFDLSQIHSMIKFLVYAVIVLQSFFLFLVFYRVFVQIFVFPFLLLLRKELEKHYRIGNFQKTNFFLSFRNFLWSLYKTLLFQVVYLFLLVFTFFLGPLQPLILFLYQGYSLGYGIYDILLEQEFPTPKERYQLIESIKKEVFFTGVGALILIFIPILGVILSPVSGFIAAFQNRYQRYLILV
ncbi:MAG: EI24 domain-containing protein [Leptospiraceae bacterium]|nr:EI24 domain-containing protein [Leptospiraceae bacterium]MDW7976956.1 EI24 domain-containing protein [Leptospiraceae bacterium]